MVIKRLLIAAGSADDELSELPTGVRALIDSAEEILVVSPKLPSRLEWLASDTDKVRERADERLAEVIEELEETGTEVKGTVGADDPILALVDAVAEFSPEHIVLVLRPDEQSGWQEEGLIDEVIDRFEVPVTTFKVGMKNQGD